MHLKFKVRIYALFQFISLIAILVMVIGVMASFADSPFTGNTITFWKERVSDILRFAKSSPSDIFASVLFYIGIALVGVTWFLGWSLFIVKTRNFYDQLFLMFVCIPFFSNIFALFAQLSLNTHKFTNPKLAKEEIEQEKTTIIKLFEEKRKKLAKEAKQAKKEVAVAKAVETTSRKIKQDASKTSDISKPETKKKAISKKVVASKPTKKSKAKNTPKKSTKKK